MEYIKENNLEALPEFYTNEQRMGFRFLQGVGWDNKRGYEELFMHNKWRLETFPLEPEKFQTFLDSGCLYVSGRATKAGHQPILVCNVLRLTSLSATLEEQSLFAQFFFDWVIRNMMVPGHIENWLLIFDFNGIGITQLPVNQIKSFSLALNRNFRGRMFRNIIVNVPYVIMGAWTIIKGWSDQFVQQKMVLTYDPKEELSKYANPEDLEQQYGGVKENMTQFWPVKY